MDLENVNVIRHEVLIKPEALKSELPVTEAAREAVQTGRTQINRVLSGEDHRLIVVTGPCSIHDTGAALDYGRRLKALADELKDDLLIVMRTYFEKPRTSVGWKGLINDPHLDDSFRIDEGLRIARKLLLDLSELGLPLATEALDPISPQYLQDLISWSAIGARTTESQTHREMASGLSCAVGFKNSTDGTLDAAINALKAVVTPHSFLGLSGKGEVAVFHTRGNPNAHIVLRGGVKGPNYDAESIAACENAMNDAGLSPAIMVDCSHANSSKDHNRQPVVARDVAQQIQAGNRSVVGIMLESNIGPGNQKIGRPEEMQYGVSVTDACIDWGQTQTLLRELAGMTGERLAQRVA